ncbi:MAG: hypothetical protein K8Q89_08425 [Nitrosarchaeum sp.]|nr:hypothetical protein [Nitrosarchaeum sp.]
MIQRKIKTLIEIDRKVWSQTKAFATTEGYNLSKALERLISDSLLQKGYHLPKTRSLQKEVTHEADS